MMTLNNNEKDFQKKMQQDTEIPAIVQNISIRHII